MNLVNLLPHPISIMTDEGTVTLPKANNPCRVDFEEEHVMFNVLKCGIEVEIVKQTYGHTYGLPGKEPGVRYIVSQIVVQANPEREDLYHPADLVRDSTGQIIGCRKLGRSLNEKNNRNTEPGLIGV